MSELIPEGWITTEEAVELTGFTRDWLWRLAREKRVLAAKVGRAWLFHRTSVEDWKATAKTGPKPKK